MYLKAKLKREEPNKKKNSEVHNSCDKSTDTYKIVKLADGAKKFPKSQGKGEEFASYSS